jgi:hypothetical protein
MLAGYYFFLDYLKNKKISRILLSCLFFLILSFEHPFNLVVVAPVLFLTAIWSGLSWGTSIFIGIGSSIGLLYSFYSTLVNPTLATWQNQNVLLSPSPTAYAAGFGLILILALTGIEKLLNEELSIHHKFLITWVTVCGLLLYFPLNFQRRLVEGIHIPLAILATAGLLFLAQKTKVKWQSLLITLSVILLSVTSFFMVYSDFRMISQDNADSYYYHISPPELSAIKWLGSKTTTEDVILSNTYFGNLIPGIIGRTVYIGHKIQTTNWDQKSKDLDIFVNNNNPTLSQEFLSKNRISYIFTGKGDILVKNGFKPENYPNLEQVYNQDGTYIYKVVTR